MALPSGFVLRGRFFELALPAPWQAHSRQAQFGDVGAVDAYWRRELVVATTAVKVRAAKAEGHSFESLCRQLAEARRATIARFAAATDDVEPLASKELSETKVLMFRARLANGPFAATQLAFVGIGAPTGRAGRATTRERAFLSCTFFDHTGVELDPFVRDVMPRLKWRL